MSLQFSPQILHKLESREYLCWIKSLLIVFSCFIDRTERRFQSIRDIANQTDPVTPIVVSYQCQSGDYTDCYDDMPEKSLTGDCNGILMFTNQSSSCGENCENNENSRKIIRKGWTLFTRYLI